MTIRRLALDTPIEIERRQIDGWRRMSSEQKAAIVDGLTQAAFDLTREGIRHRYPEASSRERRLRLAITTLGIDLARKAFPDVAALDGL